MSRRSWETWLMTRTITPLGLAGVAVLTWWGQDSVAGVILFPILALVWGMFVLSSERPAPRKGDDRRRSDASARNWHALSLLALFILLFFEGAVVALAQSRNTTVRVWLLVAGLLFGPYLALSAWAHTYLRRT